MEEFTEYQKLTILWLLNGVINADHVVHENEVAYYDEVIAELGVSKSGVEQAKQLNPFEALAAIREMTVRQKEYVAKIMGKMIVVDEDINYNEVKLYNNVCHFCDINRNFDINEYPDYSLSGPFNVEE